MILPKKHVSSAILKGEGKLRLSKFQLTAIARTVCHVVFQLPNSRSTLWRIRCARSVLWGTRRLRRVAVMGNSRSGPNHDLAIQGCDPRGGDRDRNGGNPP